ncbi:MAG TPA: TolC family protein [Bacteroidales bacterium]|jgi:outer membrane protein TolC|nr:TolC family protein [Bacteroidales bacterium]
MDQARDYALEKNRSILSSKLDLDIANKKIRENLSSGLPQLSVDANYLHQFQVPELSFGPFFDTQALPSGTVTGDDIRNAFTEGPKIPLGVRDNTVINATLSQLIFNGQYLVALKTAKIVRELSEKAVAKTEDQVKQNVEVSYYSILVLQENIRLLEETGQALDRMFEEVSGMNKQGLNEETDVDQVNVNRSNVQAMLETMNAQLDVAYKQFRYLLGIGFDQPVELSDSIGAFIQTGDLMYPTENEFNLENSLDYQMTDIQESINEQVVKLQKATYYPTISAFYRHQEQTNQPAFNFAVKDVVGANFSFPLLSGGLRSSKVGQAKLDLQKSRLNKENTGQALIMEYETARNNYQSAYSTYSINRKSMELSRKIYERTMIKFREGVSASFELTQIQNQFLQAESNYYNSLLNLLKSRSELDRILRINSKQ